MKIYTTHEKQGALPRVVGEGFSPGAMVFGALWLLAQGAWIPALLIFAAGMGLSRLAAYLHSPAPIFALLLTQGIFGRDLVRWSLGLRGWREGPPVAATGSNLALLRFLDRRGDLRPPA